MNTSAFKPSGIAYPFCKSITVHTGLLLQTEGQVGVSFCGNQQHEAVDSLTCLNPKHSFNRVVCEHLDLVSTVSQLKNLLDLDMKSMGPSSYWLQGQPPRTFAIESV